MEKTSHNKYRVIYIYVYLSLWVIFDLPAIRVKHLTLLVLHFWREKKLSLTKTYTLMQQVNILYLTIYLSISMLPSQSAPHTIYSIQIKNDYVKFIYNKLVVRCGEYWLLAHYCITISWTFSFHWKHFQKTVARYLYMS